jgi:MAF protein
MQSNSPKLLLASSSPYRAKLIGQLGLTFETFSPDINESPLADESPKHLAKRLSEQKAAIAQAHHSEYIIIASDQVATLSGDDKPLGKPLSFDKAHAQLTKYSGKTLSFYTGLSLYLPEFFATKQQVAQHHSLVESFQVTFRALSDHQIRRYLEIEKPFDCAGSFKAEGLGISLFERFEGRDYNTLIGLPLMALVDLLLAVGIDIYD